MGTLSINIAYKNEGLVLSPSDLIDLQFYGVNLCTIDGRTISSSTIAQYIKSAQEQLERYLNIKLKKQTIQEEKDFNREDWMAWGFIKTTYPASKAHRLDGVLNQVRQITYPPEWLSTRRTSDGKNFNRSIHILPGYNGTTTTGAIVYAGILPHVGFMGNSYIPNYWSLSYCTGFDKIPADILRAISMIAAIPIYIILGNGLLASGATSQSISIDGLSQSQSIEAGGYTTRVKQLTSELQALLKDLRSYYSGLSILSC